MRRLPTQEDTTKLGEDRWLQLRSVDGRRTQRNDGVVLGGLVRQEPLREQCAVRVGAERAAAAAAPSGQSGGLSPCGSAGHMVVRRPTSLGQGMSTVCSIFQPRLGQGPSDGTCGVRAPLRQHGKHCVA